MKIKSLFVISALLLSLSAQSQQSADAILWKVSGNGLQKPSYIFGTIHLYCDFGRINKPEITDAVGSSDYVVMELDLNDFSVLTSMIKASMKEASRPISSYLSPDEYRIVDSACIRLLGDSLRNLDNRSPMMLLSKFYSTPDLTGCNPLPIDLLIADLAKRSGIKTHGLETFAFQDSLLGSIPDSLQVRWLMDFCSDPQKAAADFRSLVAAYDSQSASELYRLSFEISPETQYLKEGFLDMRNRNWVEFMKLNMGETSLFVAVGAAHLGGDTGLLELLKREGYVLTPIRIRY